MINSTFILTKNYSMEANPALMYYLLLLSLNSIIEVWKS